MNAGGRRKPVEPGGSMLKAKVKREEFKKGLDRAASIAGKFTSMPILSHVLLETRGDKLVITATDLEISFQASYDAEVSEEGRITVPAKTLQAIVDSLADDSIVITEKQNQTLEVKAASFRGKLLGLSPDDFPRIDPAVDSSSAEFGSDSLADAIGKTISSVSTNSTSFNLSGVFWMKENKEGEGETLRLVSTDSNRLNIATMRPADIESFQPDQGVIVSRKGMSELRALAEGYDSVRIGLSSNMLSARADTSVLVMRLLEGKFPDYNGLMPPPPTLSVELHRQELYNAIHRMDPMTTSKYRVIFLRFEQDRIVITTDNPELGEAEQTVPIDFSGEPFTVGFDPRHIKDAITPLRSERFRIKYVDDRTPVVLTADDDPGWLCILSTVSNKDTPQYPQPDDDDE
jgi:DNA polymerase-3 subunit beta